MPAPYEQRLARLAVGVGANVAPGQEVVVLAMDVEQAPLARAIADEAYAAGARLVSVVYWDAHVKHSRLRPAPADSLGVVPEWSERLIAGMAERRGAVVIVWGAAHPGMLDEVEPERA